MERISSANQINMSFDYKNKRKSDPKDRRRHEGKIVRNRVQSKDKSSKNEIVLNKEIKIPIWKLTNSNLEVTLIPPIGSIERLPLNTTTVPMCLEFFPKAYKKLLEWTEIKETLILENMLEVHSEPLLPASSNFTRIKCAGQFQQDQRNAQQEKRSFEQHQQCGVAERWKLELGL